MKVVLAAEGIARRRSVFERRLQPVLERVAAAAALIVLLPVLFIAAMCIVAESGLPVLFRQKRVGESGKPFTLFKLRSMRIGSIGAPITAGGDSRVTRVGAVLRKYKIDELPQLWNVLMGEMQLIGARPELPMYVDGSDPLWRALLTEKPGVTDLASLVYRNEEELLARHADPELAYRRRILPDKLRLSMRYRESRDLLSDCRLVLLTARYSFFPSGFDPERVEKVFLGGRNERS